MHRLPSVGSGAGNAFLVWGLIVMVACAFLALSPLKLFRMLSWGRPLPQCVGNRWVLIFYRVTGVAILIWVLQMLFEFFTA
jgi:hypothetical protein